MLVQLEPGRALQLRHWFLPDACGPLVGLHVLNTGNGAIFVDRWPEPRALVASTGSNYQLLGDPAALSPEDLRRELDRFVDAPDAFEPMLRLAFPRLTVWPRVILELSASPRRVAPRVPATVRRLSPDDAQHVQALNPDLAWISDTWGGPPGLCAGGMAYGAFLNGRLVSLACSFFVGDGYEDIGVVTEPEFRRQGLSAACAAALCADIVDRRRRPSWSTSPDNIGSLSVARALGFVHNRDDRLFVTRQWDG